MLVLTQWALAHELVCGVNVIMHRLRIIQHGQKFSHPWLQWTKMGTELSSVPVLLLKAVLPLHCIFSLCIPLSFASWGSSLLLWWCCCWIDDLAVSGEPGRGKGLIGRARTTRKWVVRLLVTVRPRLCAKCSCTVLIRGRELGMCPLQSLPGMQVCGPKTREDKHVIFRALQMHLFMLHLCQWIHFLLVHSRVSVKSRTHGSLQTCFHGNECGCFACKLTYAVAL